MLKFRTHGKWILAGEHTVLRGGRALVFPVESRYLDFEYEEGDQSLSLKIDHPNSDLEMAFWGVLEKALQKLQLNRADMKGTLTLKSNIPVGAGMGASATLCVSLAKWFTAFGKMQESEQYEFSKSLEDLFHGQSSGVDVAVALRKQPLTFKKPNVMESFNPAWKPHFYLSYCGKRGVTADCIQRVQSLIEKDEALGEKIDQDMFRAVDLCFKALNVENDMATLKDGITLANSCFERWGLVSQTLKEHQEFLHSKGAFVTKPTGSGDGGFVLSLWEKQPPVELQETLIRA